MLLSAGAASTTQGKSGSRKTISANLRFRIAPLARGHRLFCAAQPEDVVQTFQPMHLSFSLPAAIPYGSDSSQQRTGSDFRVHINTMQQRAASVPSARPRRVRINSRALRGHATCMHATSMPEDGEDPSSEVEEMRSRPLRRERVRRALFVLSRPMVAIIAFVRACAAAISTIVTERLQAVKAFVSEAMASARQGPRNRMPRRTIIAQQDQQGIHTVTPTSPRRSTTSPTPPRRPAQGPVNVAAVLTAPVNDNELRSKLGDQHLKVRTYREEQRQLDNHGFRIAELEAKVTERDEQILQLQQQNDKMRKELQELQTNYESVVAKLQKMKATLHSVGSDLEQLDTNISTVLTGVTSARQLAIAFCVKQHEEQEQQQIVNENS